MVAFCTICSGLWPSSCLCALFICSLYFNVESASVTPSLVQNSQMCVFLFHLSLLLICLIPSHFDRTLSRLCTHYLNTPMYVLFTAACSLNIIIKCLYMLPGTGTLCVSCDRWNVTCCQIICGSLVTAASSVQRFCFSSWPLKTHLAQHAQLADWVILLMHVCHLCRPLMIQ